MYPSHNSSASSKSSQATYRKGTSYQQMHNSGPSKYTIPSHDHYVADQIYVKLAHPESEVAAGAPESETVRESIQAQ